VIALAGTVQGCARQSQRNVYVAKVGRSYLTQSEVSQAVGSGGDVAAETKDFINAWITTELLYQEALQRGLEDEDAVRRRIENSRKRIVIDALLEEVVYDDDTSGVTESEIEHIYREKGEAYQLREDVVQISFARFTDRDAANAFRSRLLRGTSWESAIAAIRADSAAASELLQVSTREYFSKATLYPDEVWKLARTLGREEVSFVARTSVGYYVVITHGVKRQGEIPDLDYVRDEIRDRILIRKRQERYDRLLTDLRAKFAVTMYSERADTSAAAVE
jgi:PPIC-type PPIASE domain